MTPSWDSTDLTALVQDAEPFPDSLIKTKPTGYEADYVPWYEYAQRLLLHHPDHGYRLTSITYAPGYTYPKKDKDGRLTDELLWAPPVWAIAVEFEIDGNPYAGVGESDSPTAAESNAYKRALSHRSIGLHLYNRGGYWLHRRLVQVSEESESFSRSSPAPPEVSEAAAPSERANSVATPPSPDTLDDIADFVESVVDGGEDEGVLASPAGLFAATADPDPDVGPLSHNRLLALIADTPSGFWTRDKLEEGITDLYALMEQAELWGPEELKLELAARHMKSVKAAKNKTELVAMAVKAWDKATPDLKRLR